MLGWLEWPANIAVANLVWCVLSLPLVTWLTAAVAITGGLERWRRTGDGRIATNALVVLRETWRRTLPLSVVSTVTFGMLALNVLFLLTRTGAAALLLLGATATLLFVWVALHLTLVPLIALFPDAPWRGWLRDAVVIAFGHPLATVANVGFTVLLGVGLVLLPTLVPFASAAVIALVALRSLQRHLGAKHGSA